MPDYVVECSEGASHPEWDAFLQQASGGHHVQSSLWGQVKASQGWHPARVLVREDGAITAGAQMLVRALPGGSRVAYVAKGPVLRSESAELQRMVLHGLDSLAQLHRVRHLTVQPPNDGAFLVQPLLDAGYSPDATPVAPVATVQIDLKPDLEQILAQMRKNHRRYVRYGLRQGMTGRVGTEADLESFHRLVVSTSSRQGFAPHPLDHFRRLWRTFHPSGSAQLFLTEYEGQLVSGQLAIGFGDRVIAKNSGWTGEHGSLGPNHVMEWTTLQWAKEHGYRYYDLEGIDVRAARLVQAGDPLPEKVRKSHSFYKLGFGGEVAIYPAAYASIPNPVLRWGYGKVYPRLSSLKVVKTAVSRVRTR